MFFKNRSEELDSQKYSDKVTIILRETETIIFFEMPQLTADLNSPEGQIVQKQNERYDFITTGDGSKRKLINTETQTPKIYTKTRSTYLSRVKRQNFGTFVNNWVMHDTYSHPGLWEKIPEPFQVTHKKAKQFFFFQIIFKKS